MKLKVEFDTSSQGFPDRIHAKNISKMTAEDDFVIRRDEMHHRECPNQASLMQPDKNELKIIIY